MGPRRHEPGGARAGAPATHVPQQLDSLRRKEKRATTLAQRAAALTLQPAGAEEEEGAEAEEQRGLQAVWARHLGAMLPRREAALAREWAPGSPSCDHLLRSWREQAGALLGQQQQSPRAEQGQQGQQQQSPRAEQQRQQGAGVGATHAARSVGPPGDPSVGSLPPQGGPRTTGQPEGAEAGPCRAAGPVGLVPAAPPDAARSQSLAVAGCGVKRREAGSGGAGAGRDQELLPAAKRAARPALPFPAITPGAG